MKQRTSGKSNRDGIRAGYGKSITLKLDQYGEDVAMSDINEKTSQQIKDKVEG